MAREVVNPFTESWASPIPLPRGRYDGRLVRRRHLFIPRTLLANATVVVAGLALLGTIILWFAGRRMTPTEIEIPGPGYGKLFISSFEGRMVVGIDDNEPDVPRFFWWSRRSARSTSPSRRHQT